MTSKFIEGYKFINLKILLLVKLVAYPGHAQKIINDLFVRKNIISYIKLNIHQFVHIKIGE